MWELFGVLKKAAGLSPSFSLLLFISPDGKTEGKKTYRKREEERDKILIPFFA